MRVCAIPLATERRNPAANLAQLKRRLDEVASAKPDLICLPECTLTGYLYEENDFERFAARIPGAVTDMMGHLARTYDAYLCFGMLETAADGVYNAGVLLDRTGRIVLTHRKNEEKPPFANGDAVRCVDTALGWLGLVICGDLFNAGVVRKLHRELDLLLMPMSRSFSGRSPDLERWMSEERQVYLDAVRAAGATTLIVNALEIESDDRAFGGALIVRGDGTLLAESPHGTDQALILDLQP